MNDEARGRVSLIAGAVLDGCDVVIGGAGAFGGSAFAASLVRILPDPVYKVEYKRE